MPGGLLSEEGDAGGIPPAGVPAVFLDRDGVLCEERGYLRDGDRLSIFPFAAGSVRRIHEKGFLAIVVTNQSGVARGFLSEAALKEMNRELMERTGVDAVYYCPHLEGGAVSAYSVPCDCRKPKTGLIDRARGEWGVDRARSWLVGDRASDILAGQRAGLRTALVESGYSVAGFEPNIKPDYVCADLRAFAEFL